MDISRIESGDLYNEDIVFSNKEQYNLSVKNLKSLVEQKGIIFQSKFSVTNDKCFGAPQKFHRVVDNLIGNAIKFTKPGGTIFYEFKEIPCHKENIGMYQITVEDTGVGMSEEVKNRMFDSYYRPIENEGKIEGTGLGLSIVKNIIEYCSGTISVQSKIGCGTKIIVTIPMLLQSKENIGEVIEEEIDYSIFENKSVLVVEDHPINQQVVTRMLERQKINVTIADNGQIAVDKVRDNKNFDIILMDIMMPVLNGLDATIQIRQMAGQYYKSVPIIAMTANAFTSDIRKSKEIGMNEHIAKPVEMKTLYSTLYKWLRK